MAKYVYPEQLANWGECATGHIYTFEEGADSDCRECLEEQRQTIRKNHEMLCDWDPNEVCQCANDLKKVDDKEANLKGRWILYSTVGFERDRMEEEDSCYDENEVRIPAHHRNH